MNRNNLHNYIMDIQQNNNIGVLSSFIEGGISKLNKTEKKKLEQAVSKYTKNDREYNFGDNKIILDDEQYNIVTSEPDQNIRVLACAGSGKTTTILCRIKHLLDNYTVPSRILVLTFNKDASDNLKNRIIKLFGFNIKIDIYTIDAFCCLLYHKYTQFKSFISISEYIEHGRKIMLEYGSEISAKYGYVFFDEFQDVNSKQFDILSVFVKNGCYLTVIGDDAQNIYMFRGSDNYYMLNFDNIFPSSTYTINTNYRSNSMIVNLANNIIKYNTNQINKTMKARNNDNNAKKPKFILYDMESTMIRKIILKIRQLMKENVSLDNIAILSRNNYYLKTMETELTKERIDLVSCITDKEGDSIKKILEPNKIAITTIHKSKGLEWKYVFIIGFANQHFPSQLNNNIKNIDEERRLFYVGCTRAKDELCLMAPVCELPISCFIEENQEHIDFEFHELGDLYNLNVIFGKSNNITKTDYCVTDICGLLNTEIIKDMRDKQFISDLDIDESTLFDVNNDEILCFTKEIKKGGYEADFGEFVDRYVTRAIMSNNNDKFIDNDVMMILESITLSDQEYEIYNKYSLDKIVLGLVEYNYENNEINKILEKIKVKNNNKRNIVVKNNTYPTRFLNLLRNSYTIAQSKEKNVDIIEHIYNVSLCRKFNNDRRRLLYKNVLDIFEAMYNMEIKSNMDKYIELVKNKKSICKKIVFHKYENVAILTGEIDIIIDDTLIDIKCSESKFKLEWYMQLLLYYTFLDVNIKSKIKYFAIINIMDGKYYKLPVPEINYKKFIDYIEVLIKRDQNSVRMLNNANLELIHCKNVVKNKKMDYIIYPTDNKRLYTIILDTETSVFYNDILQLAYVLCDDSGNIVKTFNRYVKNRVPSFESIKIHKIDLKKIRRIGVDFNDIMNEFINDLSKCHTVVGHNVKFDLLTISNDISTYQVNILDSNMKHIVDIFGNMTIKDTSKMHTSKISLENLYSMLFNKKIENAHNAYNDVIAPKECYFELLNL